MKSKLNFYKDVKPKLDKLGIKVNNTKDYKNTKTPTACTCLKSGYGKKGQWKPRISSLIHKSICCPPCGKEKVGKKIFFRSEIKIKNKCKKEGWEFKGFVKKAIRPGMQVLEYFWRIVCIDCLQEKIKSTNEIIKNEQIQCSCHHNRTGNMSKSWKGFGVISGVKWGRIRDNAKRRNHKFDISIEYAWNLFLKQNKKCAYTGFEMNFKSKDPFLASLDQIKPGKGYIKGNVQWVIWKINEMKNNSKHEDFINYCHMVSDHVKKTSKQKLKLAA